MSNWLYSLQCLEQVENAAIVRDPKKKQKLNAIPASSGCYAGVSAGAEVVVSVTTPFYCSQCLSVGRQQSSSQTAIRCHHCHSQTDSGRSYRPNAQNVPRPVTVDQLLTRSNHGA